MNEREADPTGAFHGGGAASTEPDRDAVRRGERPGADEAEREAITSGTAATSEIGDPGAQADAEVRGDGTPLPEGSTRAARVAQPRPDRPSGC